MKLGVALAILIVILEPSLDVNGFDLKFRQSQFEAPFIDLIVNIIFGQKQIVDGNCPDQFSKSTPEQANVTNVCQPSSGEFLVPHTSNVAVFWIKRGECYSGALECPENEYFDPAMCSCSIFNDSGCLYNVSVDTRVNFLIDKPPCDLMLISSVMENSMPQLSFYLESTTQPASFYSAFGQEQFLDVSGLVKQISLPLSMYWLGDISTRFLKADRICYSVTCDLGQMRCKAGYTYNFTKGGSGNSCFVDFNIATEQKYRFQFSGINTVTLRTDRPGYREDTAIFGQCGSIMVPAGPMHVYVYTQVDAGATVIMNWNPGDC